MYLSLTVFILLWSKAKVQLLYPLLVERFRPHKVYIFLIWITMILIKNIYTLWGRKRFLLPVTYFSTNLVYPFTLRVTGIISKFRKSWAAQQGIQYTKLQNIYFVKSILSPFEFYSGSSKITT